MGPQAQEFTIHSTLVAHQSPALSALIDRGFKESNDFCVEWDDIKETVFLSFWQFTYTGDYDTPTKSRATAVEDVTAHYLDNQNKAEESNANRSAIHDAPTEEAPEPVAKEDLEPAAKEAPEPAAKEDQEPAAKEIPEAATPSKPKIHD